MRRLKVRALPHAMENQVRRQGSSWTRVIYLVVLIAIAVWLIDLLFGSSLFLKSEGMVLAPSATVATEYPATVRSIEAKEGDKVEKGRLIARISSQSVNESIARLTAEMATLRTRESDLRIQSHRNESLSQLADYRTQIASETRQRYETLQRRGILPADKRTAAIDSEYKSQSESGALKAETDAIIQQLVRLSRSSREPRGRWTSWRPPMAGASWSPRSMASSAAVTSNRARSFVPASRSSTSTRARPMSSPICRPGPSTRSRPGSR